jgi:hypothetical protein
MKKAGSTQPIMNPENEAESPESRETEADQATPQPSSSGEISEEDLDEVSGGVIPHTYRKLKSPFEEGAGE